MTSAAFDLAVIGGGPGGASAALCAAKIGLRVALFDPADASADKPCGEGLMPEGVDVLEYMGLTDVLARARPFAGLRYVIPRTLPLDVPFAAAGRSITRPDLQAAIDAAIDRAPTIVRFREAASVGRTGGRFDVRGSEGAHIDSSTLAVADGSSGHAAEWLGRRARRRRTRIGIRTRFEAHSPLDRVEIHMGHACEVYLTPLPDGLVNAAILVDATAVEHRDVDALVLWALDRNPPARARLGPCVTRPEARTLHSYRARELSDGRAFLVGDAGWEVDPIVGCGVTLALQSGRLAAECAARTLGGVAPQEIARHYARKYHRVAEPRDRLARLLQFLSDHARAASCAAFVLARMPRLLAFLANKAAGARVGTLNRS